MKLEIELDKPSAAPGATVSGKVIAREGGHCRRLRVELVYQEHTEDYKGATIRIECPPLFEGELSADQAFPFSFAVPDDALPNLHSRNGSVTWIVRAVWERLGFDATAVVSLGWAGR